MLLTECTVFFNEIENPTLEIAYGILRVSQPILLKLLGNSSCSAKQSNLNRIGIEKQKMKTGSTHKAQFWMRATLTLFL